MSKLLLMSLGTALFMLSFSSSGAKAAGPLVPGTGEKLTKVGDDFEDPEWGYHENLPKASSNIDHDDRLPAGISLLILQY